MISYLSAEDVGHLLHAVADAQHRNLLILDHFPYLFTTAVFTHSSRASKMSFRGGQGRPGGGREGGPLWWWLCVGGLLMIDASLLARLAKLVAPVASGWIGLVCFNRTGIIGTKANQHVYYISCSRNILTEMLHGSSVRCRPIYVRILDVPALSLRSLGARRRSNRGRSVTQQQK